MNVRKSLEKNTVVVGIEILDLAVILGLFFGSLMLLSVIRLILPLSSWFNLFSIAVIGVYIALVRYGVKQKHPSYSISLFSYYVVQPKRIEAKPFAFVRKTKSK